MNLKPYPKTTDTPNRRTRKQMRREVFVANQKANKLRKKTERLARRIEE